MPETPHHTPNEPAPEEAIGIILGAKDGCVVVQLEDGAEVLCRSIKRLHRPLGFYSMPVGQWACIRYPSKQTRAPLIVRVLPSDVECRFYGEAPVQGDGRVDGHRRVKKLNRPQSTLTIR